MYWIPFGLLAVLLVWFVASYNRLVSLRNIFNNAWHQIDVQLKRRYDLVPNLVEAVRGYITHERETLEKVIAARGAAVNAHGAAAQGRAENALTESLKSLFAVVENYPDLKANQNVMALQEELASTENRISFARQFYNDSVMGYNTAIQSIPANLVASLFDFAPAEYFGTDEESRTVPKVDLR